jgi:hypothetical protein
MNLDCLSSILFNFIETGQLAPQARKEITT